MPPALPPYRADADDQNALPLALSANSPNVICGVSLLLNGESGLNFAVSRGFSSAGLLLAAALSMIEINFLLAYSGSVA